MIDKHNFKIESMGLSGDRETAPITQVNFYCTHCELKVSCSDPKVKHGDKWTEMTEMDFVPHQSDEDIFNLK